MRSPSGDVLCHYMGFAFTDMEVEEGREEVQAQVVQVRALDCFISSTADTIECEAYEELRLLPQHDFSPYSSFNSQEPLNF